MIDVCHHPHTKCRIRAWKPDFPSYCNYKMDQMGFLVDGLKFVSAERDDEKMRMWKWLFSFNKRTCPMVIEDCLMNKWKYCLRFVWCVPKTNGKQCQSVNNLLELNRNMSELTVGNYNNIFRIDMVCLLPAVLTVRTRLYLLTESTHYHQHLMFAVPTQISL